MNGRDFEHLARRYLLPHLDGFKVKGRLLYAAPITGLLRGVNVETSDHGGFYATAFVMPLYVPEEYLTLTFGRRLRSGTYRFGTDTDVEMTARDLVEAIQEEGLFILDALATPQAFADRLSSIVSIQNIHVREAIAYTRALLGQDDDALELLDELQREAHAGTARSAWMAEIEENAGRLRAAIESGTAQDLLNEWRAHTLAHLRLTDSALDPADIETESTT